jgi:hypothetical protein
LGTVTQSVWVAGAGGGVDVMFSNRLLVEDWETVVDGVIDGVVAGDDCVGVERVMSGIKVSDLSRFVPSMRLFMGRTPFS